MTPRPERRHLRSDDPLVALHHQLASVRQDGGIDTVVLADDAGLVVAGAGPWAACEELAAYAPLLAETPAGSPLALAEAGGEDANVSMLTISSSDPHFSRDSRIADLRRDVCVRSLDIGGQRVLLCLRGGVAGGGRERRGQAADRAARGVARILGTA